MTMYQITALVLIVASAVYAGPEIDFTPCDDGKLTPIQVEIAACAFVPQNCTLKRGEHYDVGVDFISSFQADQVFNITGDLVCDQGIVCPLYEDAFCSYDHVWTPVSFISSNMTQFSLVDEHQRTVVCFNLPMIE